MATTYDIGDLARISAAFTQSAAALDPTAVSVILRTPDGIKRTYVYGTDVEVVKDSTGNYHFDYTPVMAGQHWYRWVSTGTGAAAAEERFIVRSANASE